MKYFCGMCFIFEVSQLDLLDCAFVDVYNLMILLLDRLWRCLLLYMWYKIMLFPKFLVVRLCDINILQKTMFLQNIQICNNIL